MVAKLPGNEGVGKNGGGVCVCGGGMEGRMEVMEAVRGVAEVGGCGHGRERLIRTSSACH